MMRSAWLSTSRTTGGKIVMIARALAAIASACVVTVASADALDINLNSDAVEIRYATNFRAAEFSVGGIVNDKYDAWLAHAGLLAIGERSTKDSRSEAGLGGRIYGASSGDFELLALALGGQFRWFPGNGPFGLGAYGYYAPDIVTGVDGTRFWEAGARAEFEVVKGTASLYVGYRRARAEFKNDIEGDLDKSGHVGVRISF
jgi:hypothetical protein